VQARKTNKEKENTNMKPTVTEKIRGFNFKRAFLIFFAALFIFTAISVVYQLSSGGWQEAQALQSYRMDLRASGDLTSAREWRAERQHHGSFTVGERVLHSAAGLTTRLSAPDFNAFHLIGGLFHISFIALAAAFIYAKVQNRRKGKAAVE